MPYINILFQAPGAMHDAIKNHCHEQNITIKSFMHRAIANELRPTPHAIEIPELRKKSTPETAPTKRNNRF